MMQFKASFYLKDYSLIFLFLVGRHGNIVGELSDFHKLDLEFFNYVANPYRAFLVNAL